MKKSGTLTHVRAQRARATADIERRAAAESGSTAQPTLLPGVDRRGLLPDVTRGQEGGEYWTQNRGQYLSTTDLKRRRYANRPRLFQPSILCAIAFTYIYIYITCFATQQNIHIYI